MEVWFIDKVRILLLSSTFLFLFLFHNINNSSNLHESLLLRDSQLWSPLKLHSLN